MYIPLIPRYPQRNMKIFLSVLACLVLLPLFSNGQRSVYCEHNGRKHYTGTYWSMGCETICRCYHGPANATICYDRCPRYENFPNGCKLEKKSGFCCPQVTCEWEDKCRHKGKWYNQDETFKDRCADCTCVNATRSLIHCFYPPAFGCHHFGMIPNNCKVVRVPEECCKKLECTTTTKATTMSPTPDLSNSNKTKTTPKPGSGGIITIITNNYKQCFYNGKKFNETETWLVGCQKRCQCIKSSRNHIRCTDLCYKWTLPSVCKMNPPKSGKCCQTPWCPPGYKIYYPPDYKEE